MTSQKKDKIQTIKKERQLLPAAMSSASHQKKSNQIQKGNKSYYSL